MKNDKNFLKFLNFDTQIKNRLNFFSSYQVKKHFNDIFLDKSLSSTINCLSAFFKLKDFKTLVDFEEILRKRVKTKYLDFPNIISNFETVLHIYPYLDKNLKEKYDINKYICSNIKKIVSKIEAIEKIDVSNHIFILKYIYCFICLPQVNKIHLNILFDYNAHIKKNDILFQSITYLDFNSEKLSLTNFLITSHYFYKISKEFNEFSAHDYLLKRHEYILHNFEILIAKGRFFETLIFKEWEFKRLDCYIFLILNWIQLFEFLGDIRFFNAALKLLGYFCHYKDSETNANFNILILEALLQINKKMNFLKKNRPFLNCQLKDDVEEVLINKQPNSLTVENKNNIKIVALVGENSSTFSTLWNYLQKENLKIDAIIWVNDPLSIYSPPYSLPWYPGWPNEQSVKINRKDIALPMFKVKNIHSLDSLNLIKQINPDIFILVSAEVIRKEVLALARLGTVNAHNGILPAYRGMDSVAWAVLHNDQIGCTLHAVDQGVDTGGTISIKFVTSTLTDQKSLKQLVKEKQAELLCDFIKFIDTYGFFPKVKLQSEQESKRYYRMHPEIRNICTHFFYNQ